MMKSQVPKGPGPVYLWGTRALFDQLHMARGLLEPSDGPAASKEKGRWAGVGHPWGPQTADHPLGGPCWFSSKYSLFFKTNCGLSI